MKARAKSKGARTRAPVVLVFGEDDHDRSAIRHLAQALRPDITFEKRRQPLVLIKGALPSNAKSNAREISQVAKQEEKARPVLGVLAHQDCDALEPAHVAAAARIESELRAAGCPGRPVAVTPAWEIEAWWVVFPEAVGTIVEGWRDPDDWIGKDVGQLKNAKQALKRAVQPRAPRHARPRDYEESDSIEIAQQIAERGLLKSFANGQRTTKHKNGSTQRTRSASLERFRAGVLAL